MAIAIERLVTHDPNPHLGEVIAFPLRPLTDEERRMKTIDEQRSRFPMQRISELSGGDVFLHANDDSRRERHTPEPVPVFPDLPEFHYG